MSTCVWQKYDPQYRLHIKLGSNIRKKTGHYKKVQSKVNKSQIPYEYEFGYQVLGV
jgi:hypothetical protein